MFETAEAQAPDWLDDWSAELEDLKEQLRSREAEISRLRAEQICLLRRADRLQADLAEGSRTMVDWASVTLDVSHQTASRLMRLAHASQADLEERMGAGELGLDRADLLARLRALGASEIISDSGSYSLGHLWGMVERLRRVSGLGEQIGHQDRYLVIQPSLDEGAYRLWGQLAGTDGQAVEAALHRREGFLPSLPDQTRGQRAADALVSLCLDSLTTSSGAPTGRAVTVAEVFVDASLAAPSQGEAGVSLSSGPRVGPNTLAAILCSGKVRVIALGADGLPLGASDLGEAIPPAVRSFVLHRDQGRCVIEGCRSRYRLEVHHLQERAWGGDHHPDNLVSLCWYHHHVAVHMGGMRIDPASPPHRRRLTWGNNHDPPG
ncbi:MAG: hypothetical protein M3N51_09975 [Actinomycetota bacterium]|nr:hypothetical protein [Actinomycetota bacterium]